MKLTWSEVPKVPRSPAPVRYNATNDSQAIIAARDESPAPKPTIRMHQVRGLDSPERVVNLSVVF